MTHCMNLFVIVEKKVPVRNNVSALHIYFECQQ